MAESSFANVMSIITSFNEVAECWGNVADLVAAITGDNGTSSIQSDMNQLCAEIESELQTLINAVNDQTALDQWAPCAATLNTIQSSLNDYAYALASYSDGYVLVDSQLVSFESWCDGSDGDGTNGAIWTLAKQVGNLANLFLDGGEGNPSALDAWKNLCAAATAANASGFGGQTLFTLTFRLMQEVFAILSSLFYVRESALGLYFASNNNSNPHGYEALAYQIEQFGTICAEGTIWNQFAATFQQWLDLPVENQINACATSSDSTPDAGTYDTGLFGFYTGPSSVADQPNCIIGNLQIVQSAFDIGNGTDYVVYYLQGTVVQVGPNLTLTEVGPYSSFIPLGTYQPGPVGPFCGLIGGATDAGDYSYVSVALPSPADSNVAGVQTISNLIPVVTGFQVTQQGNSNRLCLALQFGQLDVTDQATPVVTVPDTTFVQPAWGPTFFAVQGWDNYSPYINYMDLRPAMPAGSILTTEGFLSSATFAQTFGSQNGNGNRVGLVAQNAFPLYAAGVFQPTQALVNSPPIPST